MLPRVIGSIFYWIRFVATVTARRPAPGSGQMLTALAATRGDAVGTSSGRRDCPPDGVRAPSVLFPMTQLPRFGGAFLLP
jgi:hypothetical protein